MFDITVIGSLVGPPSFSADRIADLLAGKRTPLHAGGEFVGRPMTAVFADDTALAKLHTEFDWAPKVMDQWTRKTLDRERELGIHHPAKTWFLARRHADGRWLIGNICPRLRPLNQLLAQPPTDAAATADRLAWFRELFRMYLILGREHGTRLDEGLSNFGLDTEGVLYYLDDDLYGWDDLLALAHGIGSWFRAHAWFDPAFSARLGTALREALGPDPQAAHHATTLAEQLGGLYISPDRREALAAFGAALTERNSRPALREPPAWRGQRYLALLGDIHANLPALDTVLEFLRQRGISQGLVLGDCVGYGPHPRECVERVAESKFAAIQGNHDHAAATGLVGQGFSQTARWALEWTLPRLDAAHRHWLAALPLCREGEHWLAVHGAPVDPGYFNGYVYAMTYEDNLAHLKLRGIRLCFHGHSHVAAVYAERANGRQDCCAAENQALADYRHALVCPGSVGKPRNRRTAAQFGIWDREEQRLNLISLPYDVEATLGAMRDAGFPDSLRQRLAGGT